MKTSKRKKPNQVCNLVAIASYFHFLHSYIHVVLLAIDYSYYSLFYICTTAWGVCIEEVKVLATPGKLKTHDHTAVWSKLTNIEIWFKSIPGDNQLYQLFL